MSKIRCSWPKDDPTYLAYHDKEWGVPVYNDLKLFEMLILEGAQAGLSWITILKRRENYRKAYDGFDPSVMGAWKESKIISLYANKDIIRNRLKIIAARGNARAYIKILEEFTSFREFIWSFVNHKPVTNFWNTLDETPVQTLESEMMSKALKKRGFKFTGSTICYAYMQAVGMVNDHITSCFRHEEIRSSVV
ncbi:MAG: DNA-3-methyladenine glycosylase I [Opitutae bacterium]|jgi:DNA-3-methyladenine glycosylase I|nr:DNA-3-methyladenine glycosylase I [Opitutae bacterium]